MYGENDSDVFRVGPGQGADTIWGGGGGWGDAIELQGVSGGVSVSGSTVYGNGWTMNLTSGWSVASAAAGRLDLSSDVSGTIAFADAGTVDFREIEVVSW